MVVTVVELVEVVDMELVMEGVLEAVDIAAAVVRDPE